MQCAHRWYKTKFYAYFNLVRSCFIVVVTTTVTDVLAVYSDSTFAKLKLVEQQAVLESHG